MPLGCVIADHFKCFRLKSFKTMRLSVWQSFKPCTACTTVRKYLKKHKLKIISLKIFCILKMKNAKKCDKCVIFMPNITANHLSRRFLHLGAKKCMNETLICCLTRLVKNCSISRFEPRTAAKTYRARSAFNEQNAFCCGWNFHLPPERGGKIYFYSTNKYSRDSNNKTSLRKFRRWRC